MRIFLQVWFDHLYHTGKFAFFVPSIFPMHTYLKISSTTCGEEPKFPLYNNKFNIKNIDIFFFLILSQSNYSAHFGYATE